MTLMVVTKLPPQQQNLVYQKCCSYIFTHNINRKNGKRHACHKLRPIISVSAPSTHYLSNQLACMHIDNLKGIGGSAYPTQP